MHNLPQCTAASFLPFFAQEAYILGGCRIHPSFVQMIHVLRDTWNFCLERAFLPAILTINSKRSPKQNKTLYRVITRSYSSNSSQWIPAVWLICCPHGPSWRYTLVIRSLPQELTVRPEAQKEMSDDSTLFRAMIEKATESFRRWVLSCPGSPRRPLGDKWVRAVVLNQDMHHSQRAAWNMPAE